MLIRRFGIFKAKGHDLVIKNVPHGVMKGIFIFVLTFHPFLVLFKETIHKEEKLKFHSAIYKIGVMESHLKANFVQVTIVNKIRT